MPILNKPAFAISALALLFGIAAFLLAVTGALWPATPWNDTGLLSVTIIFVLLGALGMLVARYPAPDAQP